MPASDLTFLQVELFLAELERRMQWIEQYRKSHMVQIDAGLKRGYTTLEAVRDQCSVASGELMGSGKKRAKILVETLEGRYNEALATKDIGEETRGILDVHAIFLADHLLPILVIDGS